MGSILGTGNNIGQTYQELDLGCQQNIKSETCVNTINIICTEITIDICEYYDIEIYNTNARCVEFCHCIGLRDHSHSDNLEINGQWIILVLKWDNVPELRFLHSCCGPFFFQWFRYLALLCFIEWLGERFGKTWNKLLVENISNLPELSNAK